MSTEENKAVVRRYIEEWNKQNPAGVEELVALEWVAHGTPPGISPDLAGLRQAFPAFFTAFPDLHFVVEDLIAEGDKVVARVTMRGTHHGDFMGIPPTGKQVSWTGIDIERIEAGKFVEGWANTDDLGLMQQLGVIPQMAQSRV
jgi:steroid delta-isomerase-like uncharacterized protein